MEQTNTMNNYWAQYTETTTIPDVTGDNYTVYPIDSGYYHHYVYPYWSCSPENKTEKAFNLLKLFVEEKMIPEPKTFKKFCELVEKMAKVI